MMMTTPCRNLMTLSDLKMDVTKWPGLGKKNTLYYQPIMNWKMGRLRSLVNRLTRNPEHLTKYDAVIQDQLHKGIIEIVPEEESANTSKHYIPHHEIVTPEKTMTKLPIVFDASAKTKKGNQSLNDSLHRGPIILEDLCGLLMRFRLNKVALIADVEKAFHQLGLQPEDRDATWFLWLKDATKPTLENNVQALRFTQVPFGMISSPILLAATVKYHLNKANTPVAKKISDNIYVDNMVTWIATVPLKSKLPPLISFLARSCFSRDVSRFSQESLKHLVWHMLRARNQLCVKSVALQFTGKSMGPSNRRYMYALIVRLIHIAQTSNARSDNY